MKEIQYTISPTVINENKTVNTFRLNSVSEYIHYVRDVLIQQEIPSNERL